MNHKFEYKIQLLLYFSFSFIFLWKLESFLLAATPQTCLWIRVILRCCLDWQMGTESRFTLVYFWESAMPFQEIYPGLRNQTLRSDAFKLQYQEFDLFANQYPPSALHHLTYSETYLFHKCSRYHRRIRASGDGFASAATTNGRRRNIAGWVMTSLKNKLLYHPSGEEQEP